MIGKNVRQRGAGAQHRARPVVGRFGEGEEAVSGDHQRQVAGARRQGFQAQPHIQQADVAGAHLHFAVTVVTLITAVGIQLHQ